MISARRRARRVAAAERRAALVRRDRGLLRISARWTCDGGHFLGTFPYLGRYALIKPPFSTIMRRKVKAGSKRREKAGEAKGATLGEAASAGQTASMADQTADAPVAPHASPRLAAGGPTALAAPGPAGAVAAEGPESQLAARGAERESGRLSSREQQLEQQESAGRGSVRV